MSLTVSEKSAKREIIPEWVYPARCISVIDLWTQKLTFNNKEKEVHQVRFDFEIPSLEVEYEDQETWETVKTCRVIWINLTASLSWKAKLRKLLESWRWKKFTKEELEWFNLWKIVWKTCQVQVIHSEDWQYANLENVMPLMKGIEVPTTDRKPYIFEIQTNEKWEPVWFDEDVFEELPEWIQEKIQESKEFKKLYWIEDLDEQEKAIEKEIEEKKQAKKETATPKEEPKKEVSIDDAEDIFK